MLYGTPTQAAHRASFLARDPDPTRRHRQPARVGSGTRPRPQRRAPREPERAAHWLVRGLATLIVVGVVVMVGVLAVNDRRRGGPVTSSSPAGPADPLDTRAGDAMPLTLSEVFPEPSRVAGYPVALLNLDAECERAAVGQVGRLLMEHGCSQVVRAGLSAPFGDYQVTAGVFNLADAAGAEEVGARLRELVETGDGGFAPMTGEPIRTADSTPTGQIGWQTRGHYLLYCVITRPGGTLVTADDPNAARITADLVDGYLGEAVLDRRGSRA